MSDQQSTKSGAANNNSPIDDAMRGAQQQVDAAIRASQEAIDAALKQANSAVRDAMQPHPHPGLPPESQVIPRFPEQ